MIIIKQKKWYLTLISKQYLYGENYPLQCIVFGEGFGTIDFIASVGVVNVLNPIKKRNAIGTL